MTKKRKRKKKVSRNAPCPCGSGRKYKHCCEGKENGTSQFFNDAFIELPSGIRTYFLDTCVWGAIVESEAIGDNFISYFVSNNHLAGLTSYTLFELSRAERLLPKLDSLFLRARYNIWLALLYDQLFDNELASYPSQPKTRWMPLSMITDDENPNVMSKFANDPRFVQKRDEHLQFGYSEFMSLEKFKENYPPDEDGHYSPSQALDFAWCNAVDFLGRYFPGFLSKFRDDASSFDSSKISSIQMRSLLLFYKYYIYGQVPDRSDFMDFAHVSYAPYVDVYVTERNVLNALRHIKSNNLMLSDTELFHVSEFVYTFARSSNS